MFLFYFSERCGNGLGTPGLWSDSEARGDAKGFRLRHERETQTDEQLREKAEEHLEAQGAELEGARAELKTVQAELAELKETSSKNREDALMEISWLQARADDAEKKLTGVLEEIAAAKTAALAKYQSSTEFEQVRSENFDDDVRTFIYNVCREHPEWDLSFLGEAAREMVAEFNAPLETLLADHPVEFVHPADQSSEVTDRPPQVINEDSTVVTAGDGGGAEEDDHVMQIDNPTGVLSSN